jgi:hypothetical protein
MVTTSSLRAFSVPSVGGDAGVWGNELNATIGDLDTILGGSITFNSSASATVTLSTSQAQFGRIVFSGTPASSMTLNFSSAPGSFGNYDVWNATSTSANGGAGFNILGQVTSTSTGATVTIPVGNMRLVNVDGQNVQFADQVIVPSVTLPPVIPNYLSGFTISNDSTTPNTVLDIAAGFATDTTAVSYLQSASIFLKGSSAAWTVGSGNGGMGQGLSFTAATTYHIFVISNGTSSNIDFYIDTSLTAANKPTNTNFFRRIMSLMSLSSAAIWTPISQNGDEVLLLTPAQDIQGIATSGSSQNKTMTVPIGLSVWHIGDWDLSGTANMNIYSPVQVSWGFANSVTLTAATGSIGTTRVLTRTNASGQVTVKADGAGGTYFATTLGWIDRRGRDAIP